MVLLEVEADMFKMRADVQVQWVDCSMFLTVIFS